MRDVLVASCGRVIDGEILYNRLFSKIVPKAFCTCIIDTDKVRASVSSRDGDRGSGCGML